MSMKRLFTMIALVVLTTLPASTATAATPTAQGVDCGEIAAYIDMVDAQVVDEMHALVTTPGWAEDAQMASEALNSGNQVIANLSVPLMQPLLDYLAIPGEVLSGIGPKDVPASALPLHESATVYWVTNSEIYVALLEDPDEVSYADVTVIETATTENVAAQDAITGQCPEIPESYADAQVRLNTLFALLDGEGDAGPLADATTEDLEGMGFFFLFFADETVEARGVTAGSTPTTVNPMPATPED